MCGFEKRCVAALWVGLQLAGSFAATARADESEEPLPPAPPAASPAPADTEGVIGTTRRTLRATTEWLARGIDSWFGDVPFEQGGKVTRGRLSVDLLKRESEDLDRNVRFSARLRLPNLERRTYLFVGRDNERELVTDTPGAVTRQERLLEDRREDRSSFAGLGLAVSDKFDTRLGFRGGLKPYAQARFRHPWLFGERQRLEFRQTLFWTLDDHLGSTTALAYEYALSPVLTARWLNAATITQESRRFDLSSVVGLYRNFGAHRLLSLEALATDRQGDGVAIAEYGAQVKWLQAVYRDELFAEFTVGRFWPRTDANTPRTQVWAVGAGVRLDF